MIYIKASLPKTFGKNNNKQVKDKKINSFNTDITHEINYKPQ